MTFLPPEDIAVCDVCETQHPVDNTVETNYAEHVCETCAKKVKEYVYYTAKTHEPIYIYDIPSVKRHYYLSPTKKTAVVVSNLSRYEIEAFWGNDCFAKAKRYAEKRWSIDAC
jgi:hypothetical protein